MAKVNGMPGTDVAVRAKGRPSSRERIVSAAGDLVRSQGAARLSLEAVAEKAEISKGGLLYNFPTKGALVGALIADYVEQLQKARACHLEALQSSGERNSVVRSHIMANATICERAGPPPAGILAAIAEDNTLLEPIRAYASTLVERIEADDDADLSLIAYLVGEGLCALELFQTNTLTEDQRKRALTLLDRLLAGGGGPAQGAASPGE